MRSAPITIEGVTYVRTHSGQKKAYGDSIDEYEIESDLAAADVERICSTLVHKAIPHSHWQAEYKEHGGASNYFRASYTFRALGGNRYVYKLTFPYTD